MARFTRVSGIAGLGLLAAIAGSASGAVSITLGGSAPAYGDRVLNFDEPGTPTGVVSKNTWLSSHDIVINAGDEQPVVDAMQPLFGAWAGTGNSFFGSFGIFMEFTVDATAFSMQVWDPSGSPTPFGGGMGVFAFRGGTEVSSGFFTPAWGGAGNSWLNVVAGLGETFDEVRVLGFGFGPTTLGDDLSWNVVPSPAGAALLGCAGLAAGRRRRN